MNDAAFMSPIRCSVCERKRWKEEGREKGREREGRKEGERETE